MGSRHCWQVSEQIAFCSLKEQENFNLWLMIMGIGFPELRLYAYKLEWIRQSIHTTWNQLDPDDALHSQFQALYYKSEMNCGTLSLENRFFCLTCVD